MIAGFFRYSLAALFFLISTFSARADIDLGAASGTWAGDWSGSGGKGWVSMSIGADGAVEGTWVSRTGATHGSISGALASSGVLEMDAVDDQGNTHISGTIKPGKGSMACVASWINDAGRAVGAKVTLKRYNAAASTEALSGQWRGTWSFGGLKGTLRIQVGTDGRASGEIGGFDFETDSDVLTGTILPSGLFLSDTPDSAITVGDVKASGSSMSFTIYFVDEDTGKSLNIKVSLKREGASVYSGTYTGVATTRDGRMDLDVTINEAGHISGSYTSSDGSSGTIAMLAVNAGAFSGIAVDDSGFAFIFGTFKRVGSTLVGKGTSWDFEGPKLGLTITLVPN